MKKYKAIMGVLGLLFGLAAAVPASAECPKLSDVEWWTNTVPEVQRLVSASYSGNWNAYIDRWRQQRKDLQNAYDAGNSVEIKSRALVFRGDDLKEYIRLVDERISTLECLAKESGGTTAAVPSPAPAAPTKSTVASIEGKELSVEVVAQCQEGVPSFQVTNLGDRWPRLAEVSIYRTDKKGMITQRKVRMTNSQQMIFKVPGAIARDAGEVGIFVEPSWYERAFKYDAKIKC